MKIESIIKRKKGTTVKMDDPKITYKFLPERDNFEDPNIAVVEDEGHARLFLRAKEAYRLHEGKEPAPLPEQDEVLPLGSSLINGENYTIKGGDTVAVQVIINMAQDDSGLEVEEWNDLSDEERGEHMQAVLDDLKGNDPDDNKPADNNPTPAEEEKPKLQEEAQENPREETAAKGAINPDDFSRDQLVEQFQKRFGRKPSTQMKKEDIARALNQDDE